jgi:predicted TIM-barrel fold metal-dependent hydrolase
MAGSLFNTSIIDCHVHYGHPGFRQGLLDVMEVNSIARFNVVCTPHRTRLSLVPDALHLKAHAPEKITIFGGLDISPLFMAPDSCGEKFASYVDTLLMVGCDGIKMIEGKPDMRKTLPIPAFDSPVYEPYWQKLEQGNTPLIFHVNDPEEFWDTKRVPQWAKDQGWFYGDGTFIDNEKQYTEVINVLKRHPNLRVVFAHFFFLSAQLERLGGYLDRFPGMCIDLTPGIEMYHNFALNLEKTREFFIKYQDRILYGTDIGAKAMLSTPEQGIEKQESRVRVEVGRHFLEDDGEFQLDIDSGFLFGKFAEPYRGIHLPLEILEKIYYKNFERLVGSAPRNLNPQAIIGECERLEFVINAMGMTQPGVVMDTSIVKMVSNYFKKV